VAVAPDRRITDLKRRGTIRIRRSRYHGAESAPKTRGSERTVFLLSTVRKTLVASMGRGTRPGDYVFTNEVTGGPINQGEWAREFWRRPLEALNIRTRKFYATRHTFISIALTAGVNIKWLAEQCGNSVAMIEKHYGRFLAGEAEAQLKLLDPSVGSDAGRPAAPKGGRKLRTPKPRFAVSAEKPLKRKVVPTGIEAVATPHVPARQPANRPRESRQIVDSPALSRRPTKSRQNP
jgi:hypothetical protein